MMASMGPRELECPTMDCDADVFDFAGKYADEHGRAGGRAVRFEFECTRCHETVGVAVLSTGGGPTGDV